jgi:hypothetical protein
MVRPPAAYPSGQHPLSDQPPSIGHGTTRQQPRDGYEPEDFWAVVGTGSAEHIAGYGWADL